MNRIKYQNLEVIMFLVFNKEKIQTYIIFVSDLSCLKFRPVCLYSFYMLFYTDFKNEISNLEMKK